MTKEVIEQNNKKMNCKNSLKKGTTYVNAIEGYVTKINHIGGVIKSIILEGIINDFEALEQDGYGLISAKLDDSTGTISLFMIEKGNLQFRELLSKISIGKKYRILGHVGEDSIILVEKIVDIK